MRLVLQRVEKAEVSVEGAVVGSISHGLLVFLAIHQDDTSDLIEPLIQKLINLRIFSDGLDKKSFSLVDVSGSILLISQFTLYGDCSKGRRPDFFAAAPALIAKPLYDEFLHSLKKLPIKIASGIFGAHMKVSSTNDGPVTLILDSPKKKGDSA